MASTARILPSPACRVPFLTDGERTVGEMAEMLGRAQSDPVVMRDFKWLASGQYVDFADEVHSVA